METFPLIIGIVCYLVGLVIGIYSMKGTMSKKLALAMEEGKALGKQEAEAEREDIGQDLAKKLGKLQSALVDTLDAYQDTVDTVEQKLTPVGTKQLSLEYQAAQKALPIPDLPTSKEESDVEESAEDFEESSEPEVAPVEAQSVDPVDIEEEEVSEAVEEEVSAAEGDTSNQENVPSDQRIH